MKTPIAYTALLLIVLLTGCNISQHIASDYDHSAQISEFTTYSLVVEPMSFPNGASPLHKQRINDAIAEEFEALGYLKASQADIKVYWLIVIDEIETERVHETYNRWEYQVHEHKLGYKRGSLIINVVDQSTDRVIWHGKTSERVEADMPDVEEKIKRSVEALIRRYAEDMKVALPAPISVTTQ